MRVYLDNCCYNRPYDDQSYMRIHLETQAKLYIQEMIKEKKIELVNSYMLEYENSKNRFKRKSSILKYAVKAGNDLIALAAYELYQDKAYVYLLYAESTPNSNPTMTSKDRRKYSGIEKVILAFGIKTSKEKFFIDEVTRVTWAHLQQKKTGEPVEIRPAFSR